ncbi:MAG TPA: PAS domain-containing protein, partial [Anaerovoracaceae bacterium]|nr:PAS domain-containing protein [Anaerovoracaceae bacterium]
MNSSFYKQLIEESPIGYSYNEIICDNTGVPCDFKIIDVNSAYENITGLQRSKVIGRQITEVLHNIVNYEFDWIGHYGDIALNG